MTMTNHHTHPPDIYAAAFDTYRAAGWVGVLPLPPGKKHPVPTGYTGNDGRWPSYPDVYTWAEERPDANLALRLPETVVGIDVDSYGDKTGGSTLQLLEQTWGTLPATWRTTSRDDGVSGIRLYRAPAGLHWPSVAGASIEIIRHAHRYAIAWPSVHPNGGAYRWYNPHGTPVIGDVPTPDDLPLLPPVWVDGLTGGRQAGERNTVDLTNTEATRWLDDRPAGQPCPAVQRVLTKRTSDLTTPGATRHDAMLEATQRLAHLAADGHQGTPQAFDTLRAVFMRTVTTDGTRDPREAEAEWDRAVVGAVRNAAASTVDDGDPCTNPYASLARQAPPSPDQLIHDARKKDNTWTPPPPPASPSGTAPAPDAGPAPAAPPNAPATSTGTSSPSDASTTDDQDSDELPPSWAPINLAPYLDGTWTPTAPSMLARTDGHHLIYPGLIHDFHGESESGKSLVIQAETAQRVQAGDPVLYVDFESDAGQVAHRLLNLGCTSAQLLDHFTYVRPEASPYALAETEAWGNLLAHHFTLVVLDGVTDALGQFGGASKDNDDIAAWHRMVPRMLSRKTGAAVVLVDHVIKNTETRGRFAIGGQAKMAAIDGASYSVEVTEPIGKGMAGTITLRIGKDRPGEIRAHCGAWRSSDRTQEAARVVIDSTGGDGIHVDVQPPSSSVHDRAEDDGKPFRPTGIMEKISRLLEATREPLSFRQLESAYRDDGGKAKRQTFADAVNLLVDEQYVAESKGARSARELRSRSVYRQNTDPASDAYDTPIDLPNNDLSTPNGNDPVTDNDAGQRLSPTVPHRPPTVPRDSQQDDALSPLGRVGDEVATQAGDSRSSGPGNSHNGVTVPHNGRPTHPGPDWRMDYQLGEYVHRHSGEVWDDEADQ